MMTNNEKKMDKKIYIKPQVTEVRLVAGEAVLATCKTGFSGLEDCGGISENCGNDIAHS
jgi:hypothetical protein